jgi:hypothetical protein
MPCMWSWCQCDRRTLSIVMLSALRRDLRELIHCGLPSPVSMRIREGPRPTMYVFVPVIFSKFDV